MEVLDLLSNVGATLLVLPLFADLKHGGVLVLSDAREGRRGLLVAPIQVVDLSSLVLLIYEGLAMTVLIIDHAYIDQIAFSHKGTVERFRADPPKLVLLLALCHCDEVALQFRHDGRYGSEEGRYYLFITIARIDWFSRLTHDKKVLTYLVELGQLLVYLNLVL